MKIRISAMLLCLLISLTLAGCGGQMGNEIAALFEEGYQDSYTTMEENTWKGILLKDDSWDSVYLVITEMTDEEYETYSGLDYADEDYDAKEKEILCQCGNVTVTEVTDTILTPDKLDAYVGMTMGELEDAGFENNGYWGDPEMGYVFLFDNAGYSFGVYPAGDLGDLDGYSEDELRGIKIDSILFSGFSHNE